MAFFFSRSVLKYLPGILQRYSPLLSSQLSLSSIRAAILHRCLLPLLLLYAFPASALASHNSQGIDKGTKVLFAVQYSVLISHPSHSISPPPRTAHHYAPTSGCASLKSPPFKVVTILQVSSNTSDTPISLAPPAGRPSACLPCLAFNPT